MESPAGRGICAWGVLAEDEVWLTCREGWGWQGGAGSRADSTCTRMSGQTVPGRVSDMPLGRSLRSEDPRSSMFCPLGSCVQPLLGLSF